MNKPAPVDLKHHRRLRAILSHHQNAAVETVPQTAFRKWGQTFGLLEGRNILLESEGELTIFFDFLVYHHRARGRTLARNYLAKLPPSDDPDEALVRHAMENPRFSIFKIVESHPFTGVAMHDLVRGGTVFVVDEAMSTSVKPGRTLAYRLLPLADYWMTSGAGFPASQDVVNLAESMFPRPLGLTDEHRSNPISSEAEDKLAAAVTKAAFEEGTTGNIGFV